MSLPVPMHLQGVRSVALLEPCDECHELTDLTLAAGDAVAWRCWRCQGLAEVHVTQDCVGTRPDGRPCASSFVGAAGEKPLCPLCAAGK